MDTPDAVDAVARLAAIHASEGIADDIFAADHLRTLREGWAN